MVSDYGAIVILYEEKTMYLGIELGSTRIKGMILDQQYKVVTSASYIWQSEFKNGYWTYDLASVWQGMREVIKKLGQNYDLAKINAMGISAMMHGFLPFNRKNELLTPFRTWKNENTSVAARKLSNLFAFNIPLRWSIAHYYQASLDHEEYVSEMAYFTTLAGYVHQALTGRNVLGIGDASGMFPIDVNSHDYDQLMIDKYQEVTGLNLRNLLPKIVAVGQDAGSLTKEGKALLGANDLKVGLLFSPPEGDAQTGMIATNALRPKTGNVSAGTSVFSMVVLEKSLSTWYQEIDIVQTPLGDAVAMVHANECTSRIDPWIELFGEASALFGHQLKRDELFESLYEVALNKQSKLGRFMHDLLESAISDLKPGMQILQQNEHVNIDYLKGHGGYFKSKSAGAVIMEETLGTPIKLLKTAGEGGAWGMALLAAYRYQNSSSKIDLTDFIDQIFKGE